MTTSKEKRNKILNRIILTKQVPNRQILLNLINLKLNDDSKIKAPTLDKYLKDNKISFHSDKGYYDFNNEYCRKNAQKSLIKAYLKKYKIKLEEPIKLGDSIFNSDKSLYLFIIHCSYTFERQVCIKLIKFINYTSYHINDKSIFFYFSNEKDVKKAYELLNIDKI